MKIEGTYTFDAPQNVVWESLLDPTILAKILPGCEKLEKLNDNEYAGALKIKVGPVQGEFQGQIQLLDINSPHSYKLVVNGKGAPGLMKGEGVVRLESRGNQTVMHYGGEAHVGGRIASVGQRLLDSSAKALTRQSLEGLHAQIKARGGVRSVNGTPPAPAQPIPEPSQADFAVGVAKQMLDDLIPPERRLPLLIGAIAFVIFFNWWTNMIANRVARKLQRRL